MAACANASALGKRHLLCYGGHLPQGTAFPRRGPAIRPASWLARSGGEFGWQLEAWAVFSNHYHIVAHSPVAEDGAASLSQVLGLLHEKTAKHVNRLDGAAGRKVWQNFRETRLTYEKSYLARLNYTHQNAVDTVL